MSRFLAIDGDHPQLFIASGFASKGSVKLEKATAFTDLDAVTPGNAEALGKAFRERLKTAGIAPAPVLVCLGRERVILREAHYPKPDHAGDEPALVQFQISRELTEPLDSVIIDFNRIGLSADGNECRSMVCIVKKDIVQSFEKFCSAAGLKLQAIVPRPFAGLAAWQKAVFSGAVAGPDLPNTSVAILSRGEKWGELTISKEGQVVFSRGLSSGSLNSETALLGEIRRNLTVYNNQAPASTVSRLYVAEAGPSSGWSGRIAAGMQIPVQAFDPLAGIVTDTRPESRGHFAGLTGMLAMMASGTLAINLSAPRKPTAPRDPGKRMLGLVMTVLGIIAVAGLVGGYFLKAQKDRQIALLTEEKNSLEKDLLSLEENGKRMKALDDWQNKGVNWLDEFYDMTARFPDISGTRVSSILCTPREPEANAKVRYVGRIEIKVETEDGKAIDGFLSEMVRDGHYRVEPKEPRGGAGGFGVNRFNQQFSIKADITHRDPKDFNRYLDASPPAKRSRKTDGGGDFGAGLMQMLGGFGGGNP